MQLQNKWMNDGFLLKNKEMRGACSEERHEVKWVETMLMRKITHMHHCRTEMHVWDYKMQKKKRKGYSERWWRENTTTNLGEISHPCCMKAPRENHKLLKIPKSFGGSGGL